jgi:hypothetical protein
VVRHHDHADVRVRVVLGGLVLGACGGQRAVRGALAVREGLVAAVAPAGALGAEIAAVPAGRFAAETHANVCVDVYNLGAERWRQVHGKKLFFLLLVREFFLAPFNLQV